MTVFAERLDARRRIVVLDVEAERHADAIGAEGDDHAEKFHAASVDFFVDPVARGFRVEQPSLV